MGSPISMGTRTMCSDLSIVPMIEFRGVGLPRLDEAKSLSASDCGRESLWPPFLVTPLVAGMTAVAVSLLEQLPILFTISLTQYLRLLDQGRVVHTRT
mmetsp:Transcript_21173/g.46179  ORF Transcript_21173/g.46179 Transcript_21173/m.46179 type:complete len:98 (-) Transcript_21173:144-437(-)